MGWFLIIGAILLISVIIFIISSHYNKYGSMCEASGVVAFIALFTLTLMGLSLINRNARFDMFIADYENTKMLVDTYSGRDYGNMNSLTEKVIRLNSAIARHKAFVNNDLCGVWYSEDIASLEPIVYSTQKEDNTTL